MSGKYTMFSHGWSWVFQSQLLCESIRFTADDGDDGFAAEFFHRLKYGTKNIY